MSNSRPGRVTLKMVAQATGYTTNTVSHALKGKADISSTTAAFIRQKAQEMGYINDMVAGSLRSGFTYSIALILPNVANPFWAVLIKGINSELRKYNYTSLILDTDEDNALELKAVQAAISRKVDGIIIAPNQQDLSSLHLIEKNNIPYVLLGRHFPGEAMNYVVWDDEQGAYTAVSHLLKMGRKRILFINGPHHISNSVDRFKGYCQALAEAQIPYDPMLVAETNISAASDNQNLKDILKRSVNYDAIFAFSDFIAWEIMVLLAEAGCSKDIPIVGFDDIQSNLRIPLPFATIGADKQLESHKVVQILMDKINGKNKEIQQVMLPTRLILHGHRDVSLTNRGCHKNK